jgi:subtilisin family serine protease
VVKGTSISAAFVSGAAALLLARNPTLRSANLRAAILNNVDPLENLRNYVATGGRLNIAAALASEAATQLVPSTNQGAGSGGGGFGLPEFAMLTLTVVWLRIRGPHWRRG